MTDTIVSISKEILSEGYHELALRTVATKQIHRVYGYMIMDNADATYHRIYFDGINLMKYNFGSTAITAPPTDSLQVKN